MKLNLATQFEMNKGKAMFALPSCYKAFKVKMDTDYDSDFDMDVPEMPYDMFGDIALINFIGFTVNNATEMEEYVYGVCSLQNFYNKLLLASIDDSVKRIVVNFDSGGGYIQYIPEVSQLMQSIKQTKEIYAYTSGYLCSAAYDVAMNCNYIIASPSAYVGSIGSYIEFVTYNGASELSPDGMTISNLDDLGITVTTIQDGTEKTIGSEFIALSEEQMANELEYVKAITKEFRDSVTANRGNVDTQYMQGDYYTGKQAMELNTNLIDGLVDSLSEFILTIS